jgi:hypothetical protein
LTEEIICYYQNGASHDWNLKEIGKPVLEDVKLALDTAIRLDPTHAETRLIEAEFNLFYPTHMKANRQKGIRILEALCDNQPGIKETYYDMAVYFHRNNKKTKMQEWIGRYSVQFGKEMDLGFMSSPKRKK